MLLKCKNYIEIYLQTKKHPEAKRFGIHWNIVKTESLTACIYGPHMREETCTGSSVNATQLAFCMTY